MHGATAVRTEGIEDLLRHYPDVRTEMDSGYQGLARDFPAQVSAPPKKPGAGLKGVFQSIGMTGKHDNQQVP